MTVKIRSSSTRCQHSVHGFETFSCKTFTVMQNPWSHACIQQHKSCEQPNLVACEGQQRMRGAMAEGLQDSQIWQTQAKLKRYPATDVHVLCNTTNLYMSGTHLLLNIINVSKFVGLNTVCHKICIVPSKLQAVQGAADLQADAKLRHCYSAQYNAHMLCSLQLAAVQPGKRNECQNIMSSIGPKK